MRYGSIADTTQRAVASDLLVSLLDGAKTALLDLALASARYGELLGANGRTMPGPMTSIDDRVALAQMESASTEAFRALGSAFDCLAALVVLIVGVPAPVQRAEGSWLIQRPTGSPIAPAQDVAWTAVHDAVAASAADPPGWLAWALETRNAVVHRGKLLRTWMMRPGRRPGTPQLWIRTETPTHYLIRVEEHLRRRPWLPDMHALIEGGTSASCGSPTLRS